MIEAGTILQERYRIERQIGQGGMGTVFVAVDQRFGSKVAIKETFFADENLKKAFEREARLLNSLKHPALPKVNDFFTEDDTQFIVMEYIAGDDLSAILERTGEAFAIDDVINWGEQLCDALEYLHSQSTPVIHRDIKPQNLKLTPTGQIILLDFGLAKGNPTDASHHTAAKSIFGYSRNYASLEQMQGTGTDPQSDLYSLAATLYHLASGVPPADALTRAMNVLNAQSDPLIPAHLIDSNIPQGVAEVFQKTMALNAAERPASAAEFRSMLADCDKTIVPVSANATAANSFADTDLLQQETKLMSAATNVQDLGTAKVKTEVLPANLSAGESTETKVAEKGGTTQDEEVKVIGAVAGGSGFGTRTFATIGGLILLGLGTVFGVILLASEDFSEPAVNSTTVKTKLAPSTDETTNANVILVDTETPNSELDPTKSDVSTMTEEVPVEKAGQKIDKPEKADSKKTTGKNESSKTTATASSDGRGRMVFEEDGERVIIDGDKIETDEVIIDGDKIRLKKQLEGKNIYIQPPLTPEQIKRLTPKQREKLRKMEKARRELIRREEMRRKSQEQQPPPPPRFENPPWEN